MGVFSKIYIYEYFMIILRVFPDRINYYEFEKKFFR